jgi:hypothetical protein
MTEVLRIDDARKLIASGYVRTTDGARQSISAVLAAARRLETIYSGSFTTDIKLREADALAGAMMAELSRLRRGLR